MACIIAPMLVRALLFMLTAALGGCSIGGLTPNWLSADVAGPEPAYRFLIATRIGEIVGDPKSAGALDISDVRRMNSLKGASWLVCIRARKVPLLPRYYAVFIQNNRIVDSRLSVLIDQCELRTFAPFDWTADAASPPIPEDVIVR